MVVWSLFGVGLSGVQLGSWQDCSLTDKKRDVRAYESAGPAWKALVPRLLCHRNSTLAELKHRGLKRLTGARKKITMLSEAMAAGAAPAAGVWAGGVASETAVREHQTHAMLTDAQVWNWNPLLPRRAIAMSSLHGEKKTPWQPKDGGTRGYQKV